LRAGDSARPRAGSRPHHTLHQSSIEAVRVEQTRRPLYPRGRKYLVHSHSFSTRPGNRRYRRRPHPDPGSRRSRTPRYERRGRRDPRTGPRSPLGAGAQLSTRRPEGPPLVSTPASQACQHARAKALACQHASALKGLACQHFSFLCRSGLTRLRLACGSNGPHLQKADKPSGFKPGGVLTSPRRGRAESCRRQRAYKAPCL
jgi:hypothetical protein